MDFAPGLAVIRRHWWSIVVVTVLAGIVAYGVSFVASPEYSATARLLVRAREARFLTSTGQDLSKQPGIVDSTLAKSLGQTTAATMNSRAVAERVVTQLHLDEPRPLDTSIMATIKRTVRQVYRVATAYFRYGFYAEPSPYEGAVAEVQGGITATPVKDSYLVDVKATADDPELAAAIANAATEAITALNTERFAQDATTYSAFLRSQVDRAQQDAEAAQAAVMRFKQENGIADVAEALRLDTVTRDSLNRELTDTQVDLNGANAQHASLQRLLSAQERTDTSTNTIVTGRSSTTTTQVAPSKVFQDLQSKDADLRAQIAYLEAKRDAISTVLSQSGTGTLPAQEATLGTLTAKLQTALDAYKSVRSTYATALQTSAQGAVEVTTADRAAAALYPERPLRWLYALFGVLFGLAGGTGIAYNLDRRRREPSPVPSSASPRLRPGAVPQPVLASKANVTSSLDDQPMGPQAAARPHPVDRVADAAGRPVQDPARDLGQSRRN